MSRGPMTLGLLLTLAAITPGAACRSAGARRSPPPEPPPARNVESEPRKPVGAQAEAAAPSAAPAAPAGSDSLQNGIALFQRGEYARAEEALREATGPQASAYLAATLAKQRKYAEAESPARAALEANPLDEVAVPALGAALVGQHKFDEAIARMTEVLAERPDFAYAYFWRGQAYYGSERADRMVSDFQTFLKLAPTAPEAPVVRQLLASLGR